MTNDHVIISFSSRSNGVCEQISEYICSKISNAKQYIFSEFNITPCGRCSYQCFTDREACPYVDDMEISLLDAICGSKLTVFIVPNYSGYPCSNFFAFNERSLCYFQNRVDRLELYEAVPKKFIAVSNTEIDNMLEAFTQHTNDLPDVLSNFIADHA